MVKPSISILLPASLVADAPDLKQKTLKVGSVGRTLAIFRVKEVYIYNDDDPRVKDQAAESKCITTLLRYMETPQYLRKLLYGRVPELRYAGLLPPLRTPHHPLANEKNEAGEYREAVVLQAREGRSLLELGLPEKGIIKGELEVGRRLTVKLIKKVDEGIFTVPATREEISEYWGYEVLQTENLAECLEAVKADYRLGTSRFGGRLQEAVNTIKKRAVGRLAVVFGGPYAGLFEICERQGVNAEDIFDAMVNTIPEQGTATVRTEEALIATLALLNLLLR
jgi:hypothetical protein